MFVAPSGKSGKGLTFLEYTAMYCLLVLLALDDAVDIVYKVKEAVHDPIDDAGNAYQVVSQVGKKLTSAAEDLSSGKLTKSKKPNPNIKIAQSLGIDLTLPFDQQNNQVIEDKCRAVLAKYLKLAPAPAVTIPPVAPVPPEQGDIDGSLT